MPIIRQILAQFAVPDMRNFYSVLRILILSCCIIFLIPLVTGSEQEYTLQIRHLTLWVLPTTFIILIKGYFSASFFR